MRIFAVLGFGPFFGFFWTTNDKDEALCSVNFLAAKVLGKDSIEELDKELEEKELSEAFMLAEWLGLWIQNLEKTLCWM